MLCAVIRRVLMGQTVSSQPGEQRRRSTRLIETITLTVRGVDLLGQPFEERTSTLVLNFHGCRYPSKHHLPKNTWLTLEIPGESAGRERRCLRARVAWIQRPRSVRELFQIGVELESPGNVWGIDFPPDDWNMTVAAEIPAMRIAGRGAAREAELELPGFSGMGGALPAALTSYIDRLLSDSRLQAPATGSSTDTAAEIAEASSLLREIGAQLQEQADRAIDETAARTKELIERAAEEIHQETRQGTETFRNELREQFEQLRREGAAELAMQFEEAQKLHRARLSNEMEANLEQVRDLLTQLEGQAESLHKEMAGLAEGTSTRLEQIRQEMESAEAAARQRQEQQRGAGENLAAASEEARAAWSEQVQAEMAIARGQWNELLQSSLDSTVQRLVTRLGETSQGALANAEQRLTARLAEASQPITQIAAEARESLAGIRSSLEEEVGRARASLGDIEQAANRMSEYSAQLEAASQDTVNELHRRLDTILAAQVAELNRRADGLLANAAERLQPQLDSTGQEFVQRTISEVETKLAPHLERAQKALRQLAAREAQAEEILRVHRERLRQASEQNQRESAGQLAAELAQLRTEFEEARREALAKWSEELDASGVRAAHSAVEQLSQTSEWYQKKAQNDLDTLVKDALGGAAQALGQEAAEISERSAEELEQQRGDGLRKAQVLLEATAEKAVEDSRGRFGEAAEAAAKSFGQVLQGVSSEAQERFVGSSRAAANQQAAQLHSSAQEIQGKLEESASQFAERVKARLAETAEKNVAKAQASLAEQLTAALESFGVKREELQQEWLAGLEHLGNESAGQFEERLHSTCDTWMVSSVRKLNEHGQTVIEALSRAAEQTLRQTCSSVFDGLADTMRQRLLGTTPRPTGASAIAEFPAPSTEKKIKA
jgi:hypothetical protein